MTKSHDQDHRRKGTAARSPDSPARHRESVDDEEPAVSGAHPDQPAETPAEKLARLEAENSSLQDRLLRALAETENVRRRAERDLNDARQYAVAQFARDMTRVADDLERAVSSVPDDVRQRDGPVRTLIQGIELTGKELLRTLEKHGVTKLHPHGEAFDPNFHEAMFETDDPSVPHGTVTLVAEPGYAIGTRPLRPAKVAVSRGGPARSTEK